jgi:hypothetical protein
MHWGSVRESHTMPRQRLRFRLQELDLPLGATLIGRDPTCHVTLDDPLVSRRHARILVGSDRSLVEDLGSRNGSFLNGLALREPVQLCDGDRLLIGTQQIVFCDLGSPAGTPWPGRPTGQLRLCAGCRNPYPREAFCCPACEETEQVDEDTPIAPVEAHGTSGTRFAARRLDEPPAARADLLDPLAGGTKP